VWVRARVSGRTRVVASGELSRLVKGTTHTRLCDLGMERARTASKKPHKQASHAARERRVASSSVSKEVRDQHCRRVSSRVGVGRKGKGVVFELTQAIV
jgi:hypothetical protein